MILVNLVGVGTKHFPPPTALDTFVRVRQVGLMNTTLKNDEGTMYNLFQYFTGLIKHKMAEI